jgi:hypothetical protein
MKARPVVLGLSLLSLAVLGCSSATPARTYLANRLKDASGMFDLGISLSSKPSLCVYGCAAGLFALGGGEVDGYFAGLGGSRVGWTRYYRECIGLGPWAAGWSGWGEFDLSNPQTLCFGRSGLFSFLFYSDRPECRSPS